MGISMPQRAPFSEAAVYNQFKRIRNQIRKFIPEQIIDHCILRLNDEKSYEISAMSNFPPWYLYLCLKWTILHGDFSSPNRKNLAPESFIKIINMFHDLNGLQRLLNEYDNHFLYFRNIAFQQFWYQEQYLLQRYSRQKTLFGNHQENSFLNTEFRNKTGINLNDFIILGFILLVAFLNEDQKRLYITKDWFNSIKHVFSDEAIDNLLECMSLDLEGLKQFFKKIDPEKQSVAYEYYERPPLFQYPFLRVQDKYYPYSKYLLFDSLQNFIYDTLKRENPSAFMDKFGPVFETYVEKAIEYTKYQFLDEKEIVKAINYKGKLVDFIIVDNGVNVLIDAKGVEMNYLGMVSHRPEVIRDKTKTSVIKGITQGIETAAKLSSYDEINGKPIGKKNTYLLIITFKDMYLGNGSDFYEYISKDKLDRLLDKFGGEQIIPFEHMYFISIDDFDLLVTCIIDKNMSLKEILETAVTSEKNPKDKKFVFRQHLLAKFPELNYAPYLKSEFDSLTSEIEVMLKGTK